MPELKVCRAGKNTRKHWGEMVRAHVSPRLYGPVKEPVNTDPAGSLENTDLLLFKSLILI